MITRRTFADHLQHHGLNPLQLTRSQFAAEFVAFRPDKLTLLIAGQSGTGKSTLLEMLAQQLQDAGIAECQHLETSGGLIRLAEERHSIQIPDASAKRARRREISETSVHVRKTNENAVIFRTMLDVEEDMDVAGISGLSGRADLFLQGHIFRAARHVNPLGFMSINLQAPDEIRRANLGEEGWEALKDCSVDIERMWLCRMLPEKFTFSVINDQPGIDHLREKMQPVVQEVMRRLQLKQEMAIA